ncbi:glycosyl hydrolase [Aspergillus floccosus]
MKSPVTRTVFIASLVAGTTAQDYTEPPPDLSTLPSGSLFETWRPKIHVLPPAGQIGDPCAHFNDPETGLFHVGFLHNGTGISAVQTADLVYYYDVNPGGNYTIVAGGPNDPLAVFDGSVIPNGVDDKPTLFYTSVSALPIHWTLPYTRGSETQSLAVTYDNGHNFTKLSQPPVIPEPPVGLDVTGFRDPYVFQSGVLDRTLNSAEGTWYAVVSGGVHDVGPGVFLYRNENSDFDQWDYLGEWWQEPANSTWGNGDWAKRWGYNFETVNFFGLDAMGYNPDGETFATLGVEGAYAPIEPSVTSMHAMLWAAGRISTSNDGNVTFIPSIAGALDWGQSAYAAAGKVLPKDSQPSQRSGAPDRFISYIWLTGSEFGAAAGFPDAQQGWQNALLLPRELSVKTIPNVVNNELVQETASWYVQDGSCGHCIELQTLGIDIARETYAAMTHMPYYTEIARTLTDSAIVPFEHSPSSRFFVLTAQLSFPQSARESGLQSGFQILSSDQESTTIYYQFSNESIIIDRSHTSAASQTTPGMGTSPEAGRLRLFDVCEHCKHERGTRHSSDKSIHDEHIETLDLTIVVDNSILEVYANSRFALSTWVRPWYSRSTEIRFFHNGEDEVTFSNIKIFDGLYDAYPERVR